MPDFDNLMASTRSLLTGEPRPQTVAEQVEEECCKACLLYTSPSPRDRG